MDRCNQSSATLNFKATSHFARKSFKIELRRNEQRMYKRSFLKVFDPLTPCSFTCLLEFRVLRFFDEGRVASAAMKGRIDGRMCQRPKLVTIFSNLHMTFKELIFEEHFLLATAAVSNSACPFQMNFCGPSAKVVNVIMTLRKGTQVSGAKVPL